jgi:lysophospholipase L1-like esterase
MSIEVNKTERIIDVTVIKKFGKSIEADIDIAGQRVGFKQEGEANFEYIDLPKLTFDELTEEQQDSLKLTFDQLTQAEKDSLKLTFDDLTQAEKDSLKGKGIYELAVSEGFQGTEQDFIDAYNYGGKYYVENNLVPETSRLNFNTNNISTSSFGVFNKSQGDVNISLNEGGVKLLVNSGTPHFNYNNYSVLNGVPTGTEIHIQFDVKWLQGSLDLLFAVTSSTSNAYTVNASNEWQTVNFKLNKTDESGYADRIAFLFLFPTEPQEIILKNLIIATNEIKFSTLYEIETKLSQLNKPLLNKKISIVGDSISTALDNNAFEWEVLDIDVGNQISAYPTQYDYDDGLTIGDVTITEQMIGVLTNFTPNSNDIGKKIGKPLNYNNLTQSETWWGIMANELGGEILQNVSWSGSSISSHENSKQIYKEAHAWSDATVKKLKKRNSDGSDIAPDYIIIYRGTNDFSHSPNAVADNIYNESNAFIPDTDLRNDGTFGFKEGLAIMIQKYRQAYPFAKIVLCTLNIFKRGIIDEFPVRNSNNTLIEFNNAIREVSNIFGCGLIEFDKSGITWENMYPTYISDSDTNPTHPNSTGHSKLAEKAIKDLKNII